MFPNKDGLYVRDCLNANEEVLESFISIAVYLLKITINAKKEMFQNGKEGINEIEKTREVCRRKINDGSNSLLKFNLNIIANPFIQQAKSSSTENSVKNKAKFQFKTNQESSECSNGSDSSSLDLLLNAK